MQNFAQNCHKKKEEKERKGKERKRNAAGPERNCKEKRKHFHSLLHVREIILQFYSIKHAQQKATK